MNVLIVEARYYPVVTDALLDGATEVLERCGAHFERTAVPGALEIPAAIALAARAHRFEGYVALGSVVGTKLLLVGDPAPFKLLLAAIILAYLYVQRLAPQRPDLEKPRPAIALVVLGLTAGFLAGTVNVMVPVLILFFSIP